jgi:hypothetical protein
LSASPIACRHATPEPISDHAAAGLPFEYRSPDSGTRRLLSACLYAVYASTKGAALSGATSRRTRHAEIDGSSRAPACERRPAARRPAASAIEPPLECPATCARR